jgi:predicted ATPase
MITKWGVKNFKSIAEAELGLAPLTVFTGTNSSGKSAFLQSIAMLTQTVKNKDNGIIKLKGDLIDLGSFDRIYHKNSIENKAPQTGVIGINCIIQSNEDEYIRFELGLSDNEQGNEKIFIQRWHEEIEKLKNSIKETNELIESKVIESTEAIKSVEDYFSVSKLIHVLEDIDNIKNSISKKKDNFQSGKLFIKQALIEYKETENKYPQCLKIGYGASESFYEIWQKGENCTTISPELRNVDFENSSFIPSRICYKALGILHFGRLHPEDLYKDAISRLAEMLSVIPDKKLTTKEEAEKYAEEVFSGNYGDDDVKDLFYLCTNNHKILVIDEETAMFNMIPGLRDLFDKIKLVKKHSGSEYFDIELSDWYQVMSEQDKQTQEVIINELNNFGGFAGSLLKKIDDYKNYIEFLDLPWLNSAWKHLYKYFFNNIKYLGPLREDPKWEYTINSKKESLGFFDHSWFKSHYEDTLNIEYYRDQIEKDVGVKGENTPFVIYYMHTKFLKVENYYSPDFFEMSDYKTLKDEDIITTLKEWLEYIGISKEIEVEEIEKDKRFKIVIVMNGQKFNLPELGTGVSQILPILVMCLSAPVGSTLIIQEPEKNLHPKWQSRLADFFIAMSLSGRQCLIETHSEYLIYMIRYRISQSLLRNDESIQKAIKLLYAEKENGETKFHEIKVNRHGEISAWPDGFFDERQKMSDNMLECIISDMDE